MVFKLHIFELIKHLQGFISARFIYIANIRSYKVFKVHIIRLIKPLQDFLCQIYTHSQNSKPLCRYIHSKRQDKNGVSPLKENVRPKY